MLRQHLVRRGVLSQLVALASLVAVTAAVTVVSAAPAQALSIGWLADLAVGRMQDGRLEVYGIDTGRYVWHKSQVAANSGWGGWASLDATGSNGVCLSIDDSLSVGTNHDGRLELFANTGDYTMYHIWQLTPNGGYSSWGLLGTTFSDLIGGPTVAQDGCYHLTAFAQSDFGLSWLGQTTPAQGWMTYWAEVKGLPDFWRGGPVAALDAEGRLEVFGVDGAGNLFNVYQTESCGTSFAQSYLGQTLVTGLAVGQYSDGRIAVVGVSNDGAAYLKYQTRAGGSWSSWIGLGGSNLGRHMKIARNADGRLEVFAFNDSGVLYHTYERSVGGSWSGFTSLGQLANEDLEVAQNADGRLEAFALNSHGQAYHLYQLPSGGWSSWNGL